MSEYIIDRETDNITFVASTPIPFSISGKYVINVPGFLQIFPDTDSVTDIITQKIDGFKAIHPILSNVINDEFILAPNVDNALSTKFMIGPKKRTAIMPLGTIVTNPITIVSSASTIFSYWHGYTLTSVSNISQNPGPDKLLHDFDTVSGSFIPFQSSNFTVGIYDATNTLVTSLLFNQEQSIVLPAADYTIRFNNNSPDTIYFLSDWLILHN